MKDKVTLYIATHNITGKKYFGKTVKWFTEEDLQKNYHGSGVNWCEHIKEFGDDITMKIYKICSLNESDEDYVVPIALRFSYDNNIFNSLHWMNMVPENGLNGGSQGTKASEETKRKQSLSKQNKVVVKNILTNMIFSVDCEEFYSNEDLVALSKGLKRNKNKQCEYCLKYVYPSEEMYHFDYCNENPNRLSREVNCQHCSKLFKDNTGLKNHEMICKENPDRKIYNCQFCNSECATHRLKRQHEITCTQNENKELYFCQYCNKQIGTRGQLTNHETQCDLNTNSVVRIYFCQYRNKEFKKSKLNLSKHEKYYCEFNPNSKKPEFKCICGKIYTDNGNFTQHQKKCELRVNS